MKPSRLSHLHTTDQSLCVGVNVSLTVSQIARQAVRVKVKTSERLLTNTDCSFYMSLTYHNFISVQCSSSLPPLLSCVSVGRPLRSEPSALWWCPAPCPPSSPPNTGSFEGKAYVRASASCGSSRIVDTQLLRLQPLRTDFKPTSHLSFCSLSFSWHPRVQPVQGRRQ